jgi:hypothetical protein
MRLMKWLAFALVAAFVLALASGDVSAQQKKKGGTKGKAKMDNKVLVAELGHAWSLLKISEPIYYGHRARALKHIRKAIDALDDKAKPQLKGNPKVPPVVSQALVVETVKELDVILKQMQALGAGPRRKKAAVHMAEAVKEMDLALKAVAAKGPGGKKK